MAYPVLAAAVIAVSTAAPLAKYASDVHPMAIGFWRTLAVGLLLAATLRKGQLRLTGKDWFMALLAGALLAAHFWAWFASLRHTTALRSTVLVCLTPIWAGILEGLLLRQLPGRRYWTGVAVSLAGVWTMGGGSLAGGSVTGDLLALLGGILGAGYFVLGRSVRQRVGIGPYGTAICLGCALWLGLGILAMDIPLGGYRPGSVLALCAMAVGPQLTGHIGLNYAVRYISASSIAMFLLLEPVGAAAIAALFLGEIPTGIEVAGAFVIISGIAVGAGKADGKNIE
jgi:drug/metabolite transporter (DMT)-like permease